MKPQREKRSYRFFADQEVITSSSGQRLSMMSLVILLTAILTILKPLLALIFFLVLLPFLSIMITRGKALTKDKEMYLGGKVLFRSSKAIFLGFSTPLKSKEEAFYLSRGLRIPTNLTKARLIKLAINVMKRRARSRGRRKGRG